ncbi:hypothetical protein CFIICLFH_4991 [Methylobacterium goesingense]|nr:hypothetical protein CFIICLFH_4991 [Methylobacterium goesingense]
MRPQRLRRHLHEGLGPVRQHLARWVHHPEGDGGRRRLRQHRQEPPVGEVGRHLVDGFQGDALALQGPFGQHVAVVRVDAPGHRQGQGLVAVEQRPAELLRAGKAQQQAGMVEKLGRAFRRGVLREVAWGRAQNPLHIRDLAQGEGRIAHLREPDRNVHRLLHEVEEVIGEAQVHVGLGVPFAESWDQGRHHAPAEAQGRRDLEGPTGGRPLRLDALLRQLDGGRHVEAAVVENPARLRQVHPPRRARQEEAAEMLLQGLDAVADHGR